MLCAIALEKKAVSMMDYCNNRCRQAFNEMAAAHEEYINLVKEKSDIEKRVALLCRQIAEIESDLTADCAIDEIRENESTAKVIVVPLFRCSFDCQMLRRQKLIALIYYCRREHKRLVEDVVPLLVTKRTVLTKLCEQYDNLVRESLSRCQII